MAYTRIITVPNADFDVDGIVVLIDLAGSDASLTISNSGFETVDSVNPVTGEIDLSAKPLFGARTFTCIQDPQWADFGGTLNAGDHPVSTVEVFQIGSNTELINANHDEIADLNTALSGKENTGAKGVAGGYAELDGDGKVPASQLNTVTAGVTVVVDSLISTDIAASLSANQGRELGESVDWLTSVQFNAEERQVLKSLVEHDHWSERRAIEKQTINNLAADRSTYTAIDNFLSITADDIERITFKYTGDHTFELDYYPSSVNMKIRGKAHTHNAGYDDNFNTTFVNVDVNATDYKKIYQRRHNHDWRWHKNDYITFTLTMTDPNSHTNVNYKRVYDLKIECLSSALYAITGTVDGYSLSDIDEIESGSTWK